MRWLFIMLLLGLVGVGSLISEAVQASDFVIYNIYRGLNLGNADDAPEKDFYINMGSAQGLREGAVLEVFRHVATYDSSSQQLYKDMTFPIATVKIFHVEARAAIARLDKFLPADQMPSISPRALMVGDYVRFPGVHE